MEERERQEPALALARPGSGAAGRPSAPGGRGGTGSDTGSDAGAGTGTGAGADSGARAGSGGPDWWSRVRGSVRRLLRYRSPGPVVDLVRRLVALGVLAVGATVMAVAFHRAWGGVRGGPGLSHGLSSLPATYSGRHLWVMVLVVAGAAALLAAKLWVRRSPAAATDHPTAGAGWVGLLALPGGAWAVRELRAPEVLPVPGGAFRSLAVLGTVILVVGILLVAPARWPAADSQARRRRWLAAAAVVAVGVPGTVLAGGRLVEDAAPLADPPVVPESLWSTIEKGQDGSWTVNLPSGGANHVVGTPSGLLVLESPTLDRNSEEYDSETAASQGLTLLDPSGTPVWRRSIPGFVPGCGVGADSPCLLVPDQDGRRVLVAYLDTSDDDDRDRRRQAAAVVMVLEVATGEVQWVRTQVDHVLSAALTRDHVALQTAGWEQLQGSTLAVYSLSGSSPGGKPASRSGDEPVWSRDEPRRLLTATESDLALVSFNNAASYASYGRLDLVDAATGEQAGGYDDVEVGGSGWSSLVPRLPVGWVARCTDGCGGEADPASQEGPGVSLRDDGHRTEMLELGTGRTVDIGPYRYRNAPSVAGPVINLYAPSVAKDDEAAQQDAVEDPEDPYLELGDGTRSDQPPPGTVLLLSSAYQIPVS